MCLLACSSFFLFETIFLLWLLSIICFAIDAFTYFENFSKHIAFFVINSFLHNNSFPPIYFSPGSAHISYSLNLPWANDFFASRAGLSWIGVGLCHGLCVVVFGSKLLVKNRFKCAVVDSTMLLRWPTSWCE